MIPEIPSTVLGRLLGMWDPSVYNPDEDFTILHGAVPVMDYLSGDNIDWSTLTLASYRRKPGRDYASLLWELRKEGGRWWHTEGGISRYVPSWVEPVLQVFEGSCCEKRNISVKEKSAA